LHRFCLRTGIDPCREKDKILFSRPRASSSLQGLLVFGAPTLLPSAPTFIEGSMLLLPASVAISFAQALMNRLQPGRFCVDFGMFCLPMLVIALGIVTVRGGDVPVNLLIAAILLELTVLLITKRKIDNALTDQTFRE
jgi:hypothetical protein